MPYIAELRVFAVTQPNTEKIRHSAQYGKVTEPAKPSRDPKVLDLRIEATTVQKLVEKLSVIVALIDDDTNDEMTVQTL